MDSIPLTWYNQFCFYCATFRLRLLRSLLKTPSFLSSNTLYPAACLMNALLDRLYPQNPNYVSKSTWKQQAKSCLGVAFKICVSLKHDACLLARHTQRIVNWVYVRHLDDGTTAEAESLETLSMAH